MKAEIQHFNSREAAKILGVNVSTIKRWTEERKLECIKTAGGHRKFLMQHLSDFLEKNKKKVSKANLFPLEGQKDLEIGYYIVKGDFPYLINYVREQALVCNRDRVQQVFSGLYLGQYPLHEIYDNLVTPILYEIGELWTQNKISVVEEHFASQTLRDCLIRLQGIIRVPQNPIGKALCLNFATELHDIALKMVDHVLESRGYKVLFSGQMTPTINFEKVYKAFKPDRVYVASTVVSDPEIVQEEFDRICEASKEFGVKVFIGGQGFEYLDSSNPIIERRLYTFEDIANS